MSAESFKEKGNEEFKKGNYEKVRHEQRQRQSSSTRLRSALLVMCEERCNLWCKDAVEWSMLAMAFNEGATPLQRLHGANVTAFASRAASSMTSPRALLHPLALVAHLYSACRCRSLFVCRPLSSTRMRRRWTPRT